MRCDKCGEISIVVETRTGPDGTVVRKRLCKMGHRFRSREVYEPVFCSAKPRAAEYKETVNQRIGHFWRDLDIYIDHTSGASQKEICERYGISRGRIYQIVKEVSKNLPSTDRFEKLKRARERDRAFQGGSSTPAPIAAPAGK